MPAREFKNQDPGHCPALHGCGPHASIFSLIGDSVIFCKQSNLKIRTLKPEEAAWPECGRASGLNGSSCGVGCSYRCRAICNEKRAISALHIKDEVDAHPVDMCIQVM
jgi:hypothetical protein